MKSIFIGLSLILAAGTCLAELVKVPAEFDRPLTDEEKADGPMPVLPQEAAPVSARELEKNAKDFPVFTGDDRIAAAARERDGQEKKLAEAASADVDAFSRQHGIPIDVPSSSVGKPDQPLELNAGPDDTVIKCEGRLYIDLKNSNRLVYIKDVSVRNPDYELDCDDQLQIYLQQAQPKPGDKKKDDAIGKKADNPFAGINTSFDGIKKAVAYGNVFIKYKDKKGIWNEGHAERVTYDAKTGEVIMSGGYPFLKQGKTVILMKNKDGVIRYKDGNVVVDGPTVGKVDVDALPKSKKNK